MDINYMKLLDRRRSESKSPKKTGRDLEVLKSKGVPVFKVNDLSMYGIAAQGRNAGSRRFMHKSIPPTLNSTDLVHPNDNTTPALTKHHRD